VLLIIFSGWLNKHDQNTNAATMEYREGKERVKGGNNEAEKQVLCEHQIEKLSVLRAWGECGRALRQFYDFERPVITN